MAIVSSTIGPLLESTYHHQFKFSQPAYRFLLCAEVLGHRDPQTGTAVSGTVATQAVNPNDGSCNSCHRNKNGSVSGAISGSTLTLTMFFAAGGDGASLVVEPHTVSCEEAFRDT